MQLLQLLQLLQMLEFPHYYRCTFIYLVRKISIYGRLIYQLGQTINRSKVIDKKEKETDRQTETSTHIQSKQSKKINNNKNSTSLIRADDITYKICKCKRWGNLKKLNE